MVESGKTRTTLLTMGLTVLVIGCIGIAIKLIGQPGWVSVVLLLGSVAGVCMGLERRDGVPRNVIIVGIFDGMIASLIVLSILLIALLGCRELGWISFKTAVPDKIMSLLLVQVFAIAIPEELFFRGTVQEGFNKAWGTRWKFCGIEFGWGVFAASALFALGHIFWQGPHGLLTALPGLGFGLLYDRRRSVAGPVVFHVACNMFIQFIPFL